MSLADRLIALGTATLFEAHPDCRSLDPDLFRAWPCAPVAAPAFPVECAPRDNLAIQLAVEAAPKGAVLVINGHGEKRGYWGEVLTVAAQVRGIAGLVIDGGVRDVDAMEALNFPVYTRHVAIPGTVKVHAPGVGRPTYTGGVRVTAEDWIVADRDGIVVFAASIADDLLSRAEARVEKERVMMDKLKAGETMIDLLNLGDKRALLQGA